MALNHRLPAICTALFSSFAVLLAAFSGASCNFIVRITNKTNDNDNAIDIDTGIEGTIDSSFGVLCNHELYPREGDNMWELSRIFLIVGLSLGAVTAALAWAVSSFLTPTRSNWNGISALAAATAVIQVPIFVLFESEPCMGSDVDGDDLDGNMGLGCKLGPASYLLMASDLLFISVTLITQIYDRPRWGLELDLWKVHKTGASKSSSPRSGGNTSRNRYRNRNRSSQSKAAALSRNDEYYYDDNENYDDDVHLTSLRARSLVDGSSEEGGAADDLNEMNAFYKISRILPAGEAKQQQQQQQQNQNSHQGDGASGLLQSKTNKGHKKQGFFSRLLSRNSSLAENNNLEVPVGETQSMSGDDEYDYENQQLHDLEIVRVLPQQNEHSHQKNQTSARAPSPPSESGEGLEISIGSFHNRVSNETEEPVNRSFQSFDAVIDPGGNATANATASATANATSNATVSATANATSNPNPANKSWKYACVDEKAIVEQHQMIDSPSASFISMESSKKQQLQHPVVSSVRDILQDLHCEEMVGSVPHPSEPRDFEARCVSPTVAAVVATNSSSGAAPVAASDTIVDGVRKLTKKLKSADSTRQSMKSSLRNINTIFHGKKGGYCQMNSDQSSDDNDNGDEYSEDNYFNYYDGTDVKPPPGLQLLYTQGSFHSENENNEPPVNQSTLTDENTEGNQEDEIKHIYDELDQMIGDDNSIQEKDNNKSDPFAFDSISIGSTHSDPGPISYGSNEESTITDFTPFFTSGESEQSTSFTDLFKVNTEEDIPWDNDFSTNESTLSQITGDHEDDSSEEPSRGRSSERSHNDAPRRRRPISPVGSIKSHCSLLHMTIDEETEEDVKNELLDSKTTTVPSPYDRYALKRTLSSPEFRSERGPISTRRDKSTNELLKKLERLKRSINVDSEGNNSNSNHSSSNKSDLPPRTPPKATNVAPMNGTDDSSAVLSELLKPEQPAETIPAKLETSNDESWKKMISPMKDRPSKEPRKSVISPMKDKPGKESMMDATMDISDETSETGNTRSTISYDSDDSSAGGHDTGPRQIRSKSVGRAKRLRNNAKHYRASNSLSPTRQRKIFLEEGSSNSCLRSANIANLARESRIRRLQQLRKGYMPLDENEYSRAESPTRMYGASCDPSSDSELTPKRKTAGGANEKDEIISTTSSNLPDTLFQPSLLADPEENCPEFDDILNHLDLQLIDLNRMGAEYGDEEGSM
jgi:hypothetical protein